MEELELNSPRAQIGNYRFKPEKVTLCKTGLKVQVNSVELLVDKDKIQKTLFHFNESQIKGCLSVLIIYVNPSLAAEITEKLVQFYPEIVYSVTSRDSKLKGFIILFSSNDRTVKNLKSSIGGFYSSKKIPEIVVEESSSNCVDLTEDDEKFKFSIYEEIDRAAANKFLTDMMDLELEDEDEDQIAEKSREKSPNSSEIDEKIILEFPPGRGGIQLSIYDYKFLEYGVFLNDQIMNFYLKYLEMALIDEKDREKTHFYDTFFYSKLSSEFATNALERWNGVQSWTKNVDIFEKDFLIMPINEVAHWFVVIVCYPAKILNPHNNPDDDRKPCILKLDSLMGSHGSNTGKLIREYLTEELIQRKKNCNKEFNPKNFRLNNIKVPQQKNYFDCGLYMLTFVEHFFMKPPEKYPPKNLENWFEAEDVVKKREIIAEIIRNLHALQSEDSVEFPKIPFCGNQRTSIYDNLEDTKFSPTLNSTMTKGIFGGNRKRCIRTTQNSIAKYATTYINSIFDSDSDEDDHKKELDKSFKP